MLAILTAHAVATLLAPVLVHRFGRRAFYPLALVPLGSLVWVAGHWPGRGPAQGLTVSWVPGLSMDITLRFDALAAIMSVLVLGCSSPCSTQSRYPVSRCLTSCVLLKLLWTVRHLTYEPGPKTLKKL